MAIPASKRFKMKVGLLWSFRNPPKWRKLMKNEKVATFAKKVGLL